MLRRLRKFLYPQTPRIVPQAHPEPTELLGRLHYDISTKETRNPNMQPNRARGVVIHPGVLKGTLGGFWLLNGYFELMYGILELLYRPGIPGRKNLAGGKASAGECSQACSGGPITPNPTAK